MKRTARSSLPAGIVHPAERGMRVGWSGHLGMGIGQRAEAMEVQAPGVKARGGQGVPPGHAVEAVRDRQCRRKCAAMHVQRDLPGFAGGGGRRQITQAQAQAGKRARNAKQQLARIEFFDRVVGCQQVHHRLQRRCRRLLWEASCARSMRNTSAAAERSEKKPLPPSGRGYITGNALGRPVSSTATSTNSAAVTRVRSPWPRRSTQVSTASVIELRPVRTMSV